MKLVQLDQISLMLLQCYSNATPMICYSDRIHDVSFVNEWFRTQMPERESIVFLIVFSIVLLLVQLTNPIANFFIIFYYSLLPSIGPTSCPSRWLLFMI